MSALNASSARPRAALAPAFLFFFCTLLVTLLAATPASAQLWLGGDGDWFDGANWSSGVPAPTGSPIVQQGVARFSDPVSVGSLEIGTRHPNNHRADTDGGVVGSADFSFVSTLKIGHMHGTGTDRSQTGKGRLVLTGGDLTSPLTPQVMIGDSGGTGTRNEFTGDGAVSIDDGELRIAGDVTLANAYGTGTDTTLRALGLLEIEDGALAARTVTVATAGGTGTRGERIAEAGLRLIRSDAVVTNLIVGRAGGTGSPDGFARGSARLFQSDLRAESIALGLAGGISSYDSDAFGELIVEDGDVVSPTITLGQATASSNASALGRGEMAVYGGDVDFESMTIGPEGRGDQNSASGAFELHRGVATGGAIGLSDDSTLTLGVVGDIVRRQHAQLRVDRATLLGRVVVRFGRGFSPALGDTIDLIVADSITGDYDLRFDGYDPYSYPGFRLVQTPSLLRLAFVPEPGGATLLAAGVITLLGRKRRTPTELSWTSS